MFYDKPEKPKRIFDDFLSIPEIQVIETATSFLEFLKILPSSDPSAGKRSIVPYLSPLQEKLNIM